MISPNQIKKLKIISYPDPVLRKMCAPITEFGPVWQEIGERMLELMHAHRGVGLAGPQVGLPWRIFVWNPTGESEHEEIFLNPELSELRGQVTAEEGCLSIEGVNVNVPRAQTADVRARRPDGSTVEYRGEGLVARIWQHETDHLNGRLILDYMSSADEIANRRAVKDLEAKYKAARRKSPARAKRRR